MDFVRVGVKFGLGLELGVRTRARVMVEARVQQTLEETELTVQVVPCVLMCHVTFVKFLLNLRLRKAQMSTTHVKYKYVDHTVALYNDSRVS